MIYLKRTVLLFFFVNLPFFCLSPGAIIDFLMNALSVSACLFVQRLHLFSLSLFMCNESAESLFAFCYALVFFITIENHSGETISSQLDLPSPLVYIFFHDDICVSSIQIVFIKRFIEEIIVVKLLICNWIYTGRWFRFYFHDDICVHLFRLCLSKRFIEEIDWIVFWMLCSAVFALVEEPSWTIERSRIDAS